MPSQSIKSFVFVILTGAFFPLPVSLAQEKKTASVVSWKPAPALLRQLAAEVKLQAFGVRPPQGYVFKQVQQGPLRAFLWKGTEHTDKTAPGFYIITATPPPKQKVETPEHALESALADTHKRRLNWSRSATEYGQVNGLSFVRARWSGTAIVSRPGEPDQEFKTRGFVYVTIQDRVVFMISGQDVEPYQETTLKLAEAAALTFRKR